MTHDEMILLLDEWCKPIEWQYRLTHASKDNGLSEVSLSVTTKQNRYDSVFYMSIKGNDALPLRRRIFKAFRSFCSEFAQSLS